MHWQVRAFWVLQSCLLKQGYICAPDCRLWFISSWHDFSILCNNLSRFEFFWLCPEDGSVFIQNVSNHPEDYTLSHPRRPQCNFHHWTLQIWCGLQFQSRCKWFLFGNLKLWGVLMCPESFLKAKKYIFMKQVFCYLLSNYPHICT